MESEVSAQNQTIIQKCTNKQIMIIQYATLDWLLLVTERNCLFATTSDFLIPISLDYNVVNL